MRSLVLRFRAEVDLREIRIYTVAHRGEEQADRDLDDLGAGLRRCAEDPGQGRSRAEVREGYRSLLVRRHVTLYRFTGAQVIVQRILHGSMDPDRHMEEDGPVG